MLDLELDEHEYQRWRCGFELIAPDALVHIVLEEKMGVSTRIICLKLLGVARESQITDLDLADDPFSPRQTSCDQSRRV